MVDKSTFCGIILAYMSAHEDGHRGYQPALPGLGGLGPVDEAMIKLGAELAASEAEEAEAADLFSTLLGPVQMAVLDEYEKDVLEPRREVWDHALAVLLDAPFTGLEEDSTHHALWWQFDDPSLKNLGNGIMGTSSVYVKATKFTDNDQTLAAQILVENLAGKKVSNRAVVAACASLGMTIPRLGGVLATAPSLAEQHIVASNTLLQHVQRLTAHVIVTPFGVGGVSGVDTKDAQPKPKPKEVLYSHMGADELKRPPSITASFSPAPGKYSHPDSPLTEKTVGNFLDGWRDDPKIPTSRPDMETLLPFLRERLTWKSPNFDNFRSILAKIGDCSLSSTPGRPQIGNRTRSPQQQ